MKRRTSRQMRFARNLMLGRILAKMRFLCMGLALMSMVSLTLTGNLTSAIVMAISLYVVSKALNYGLYLLTGESD